MADKKLSLLDFRRMKENNQQVTWITAYDYPTAMFAERAGIDMILVGDSLGMVVMGYDGTEPVTMEEELHHCKAVRNGAPETWIIGDMPFMSYQVSVEKAVENAGRLIKEGDSDCVKLEGGKSVTDQIKAINEAGILVMGHIGLTPQSSGQFGGFKAQGLTVDSAREIIKDAYAIQEAGVFSMVVEAVPPKVTKFLADNLDVPVYGIGAGKCDGQVLVNADMLGMFDFTPRFVKKYAKLAKIQTEAFEEFIKEVQEGEFPSEEHVYNIKEKEEKYEEMFREFK
ncbi:MAG: 3-methyl-2-oxobutanoate hydroxymethyltransferase [Halanaerobiales bacterium]|nr:3-methyl-2-oxobutanoate hydroxymethyltransferase [Halanaerobiales bacterium]